MSLPMLLELPGWNVLAALVTNGDESVRTRDAGVENLRGVPAKKVNERVAN
jgi:hypothetical protein